MQVVIFGAPHGPQWGFQEGFEQTRDRVLGATLTHLLKLDNVEGMKVEAGRPI